MQFSNHNLHIFSKTMCRILRGTDPIKIQLVRRPPTVMPMPNALDEP